MMKKNCLWIVYSAQVLILYYLTYDPFDLHINFKYNQITLKQIMMKSENNTLCYKQSRTCTSFRKNKVVHSNTQEQLWKNANVFRMQMRMYKKGKVKILGIGLTCGLPKGSGLK